MSENTDPGFNLGDYEAPINKEKVHLKPGFHKLTVESFTYDKEEEGKTPNIIMNLVKEDADGNVIELKENFYLSGKLNAKKVMSAVVRILELYKGLTGEDKMTIKPTAYTYTKTSRTGPSETYTIPNPAEICEYLKKKCTGKTAIFKVGGEVSEDETVYTKLTYSGFLYYTDKKGALCKYKEERDFTESEYKYSVQKRKGLDAPAHSGGVADMAKLDEL